MKLIYLTLILTIINYVKSVAVQDCSIGGGLKATSCNLKTLEYYFVNANTLTSNDIINIPFGAKFYFSGDVVFKYPVNFNCQPTLKKKLNGLVYDVDCLQVFSNKTITYEAEEIYCSVEFSKIFGPVGKQPVNIIESYSRFMSPLKGFGKTSIYEPVIYSRIKPQEGYSCNFNPGFRSSNLIQDKYALHSTCVWNKTVYPQADFSIKITSCKLQNNSVATIKKIKELHLDNNLYLERLNFNPIDGLFYNDTKETIYIRYYPNFEKKFDLTTIEEIYDSYVYIIDFCKNRPDKFDISFGNQSDLWDHTGFNLTDYKIVKNVDKFF